jgi:hypothetical protein
MASIQFISISDRGVTASNPVTLGPTIPFRGKLYYRTEDLIAKKGLKLTKPCSVKQAQANVRKQAGAPRVFPDPTLMRHFVKIESQSPLFTSYYEDDGINGVIYSSPGLTERYVAEYCRLNHLKEC